MRYFKMKKLTVKQLKEVLNQNYAISNYIDVLQKQNAFYVVYRDKIVTYRYSNSCGWCFMFSGEGFYTDTKALLNLVNKLDENYIGEVNENNK